MEVADLAATPTTGNLSQKDGIAYTYDLQHPHAVKKLDDVDKYGYDDNGSMTSRVVNGTVYALTYDMENRLTAITGGSLSARYIYDGDGKRVLSVVGDTRTLYIGDYFEAQIGVGAPPTVQPPTLTNYSMCHDNRCLRVFLPAIFSDATPIPPLGMTQGNFGNTYYHTHAGTPQTGVKWLTYYSGGGARVAFREKSGPNDLVSLLLQDHLGSTTRAVDSQGVVTATMLYKAWGETRVPNGSAPAMPTMRRYTGQYEAEAGLYFYGARFYDPSLGRFAQADTIIPQPGSPISWDRYAYGNNSPVNYNDPDGHFPILVVAVLIFAAVAISADTPTPAAQSQWQAERAYYDQCKSGFSQVANNASYSADAIVDMFSSNVLPGNSPQERFEAVLTGADSGIGQYMDGDYTDSGFQTQYQDGGDQVGHFLQAAGLAYQSNIPPTDYLSLSFTIGHEMRPDPQSEGFRKNLGFADQFGASALRPNTHTLFINGSEGDFNIILNTFGDPSERRGNSIQDLRLSRQGWTFGKNMRGSYYKTLDDAANWLRKNIAR